MQVKSSAVLVRHGEDLWEASRATLGMAVENIYAYLIVLDMVIEENADLRENLEWLTDLECEYFSNQAENESFGFATLTNEEICARLRDMDLIIPFGRQ